MSIIGTLIKKAIEATQAISPERHAHENQLFQLENILNKAGYTSFGLYYGFTQILQQEDIIRAFQSRVPIFSYEEMKPWWEQQQKYPDITWPGQPTYFALSSGTTGNNSKRIPVTDDMLKSFRSVSLEQIISLNNFDLPAEFFEKQLLALGSSTDLKKHNRGHLEGEISGINASNAPDWFDYFYKPGQAISAIDNWDERLAAIVKEAPNWDIGAIAGIPSWVLLMLQAIVEQHKLSSIHDIWPGLKIYTSGGVAFEPYRKDFEQICGQSMIYLDTYLASEGYFAFTSSPQTQSMQIALSHGIFFEFIPFNEEGFDSEGNLLDQPKVLTIDEIEEGQEYALLVTTPAGAYRYMIGDTIKFTDLSRAEIIITGRTKYFLNVVGSQLSEEKLNRAIKHIGDQLQLRIKEFAVAAVKDKNNKYYHQWTLGTAEQADENAIIELLDGSLKEMNKNYKVARSKALEGVKVKITSPDNFYNWLEEEKKKGGQIKTPKVMSEDQMLDFLTYLDAS